MAIRQRGNSWQWDRMFNGERKRETFVSKAIAELWEEEVVNALTNYEPYPDIEAFKKRLTAPKEARRDTLRWWAEECFRKVWSQGKDQRKVRINIDVMVRYFGETKLLREVTTDDIDEWIEAMEASGNSNGTINRKLAVLSRIFRHALERGGLNKRPIIARRRETGGRIRWLTEEEETNILATLRTWGKDDHADVIAVLLDTGMRPSELYALTKQDVDLKTGMLTIWDSKTGQPRSVGMTTRVREIVAARKGPKPFPYDTEWMRYFWDKARSHLGYTADEHFVPYICRHTCASRLAQRGVRLQVIKEWMGHKTMDMTMRYAHLSPSNLGEAVLVLEGSSKPNHEAGA